jgi:putative DNA primase/helicase
LRTPVQTLMGRARETIPNDVARLRGARFVVATETEETHKLAEATVKHLTGGDMISARHLFGEWFQFPPTFKLFLATNHKPIIKGTDHAIWRRIRLVPFTVAIPEAEQDEGFKDTLLREAPGILRWMVEGCQAWQRDKLGVPDEVRVATENYRAEMDVLGDFLRDCCEIEPTARVLAGTLYEEYATWCKSTGEKAITKTAFGLALRERGFTPDRTGRDRSWQGLAVRQRAKNADPEKEQGAAP